MSFSVAADRVIEGWWTVLDHNGAVARRVVRRGQRTTARPAVFRTRAEADLHAERWNEHLAHALDA